MRRPSSSSGSISAYEGRGGALLQRQVVTGARQWRSTLNHLPTCGSWATGLTPAMRSSTSGHLRASAIPRANSTFPDGSQCETDDNDAIDELFAGVRAAAPGRLMHRWESRVRYVAAAFVLTSVLLWAGISYGIPALAKQIAFGLSPSTDAMLGQEALAGLDKVLLEPTQLAPERQAEVKALFSDMTTNIDGASDYRLEFRASKKIGANALALPSGIIVITDPLVELAKNDGELTAVLAHEIGHLRQRHDLRRVLQGSATAVLIIAVTGDMSSVASLAAALPTFLVNSKYSRGLREGGRRFCLRLPEAPRNRDRMFSARLSCAWRSKKVGQAASRAFCRAILLRRNARSTSVPRAEANRIRPSIEYLRPNSALRERRLLSTPPRRPGARTSARSPARSSGRTR